MAILLHSSRQFGDLVVRYEAPADAPDALGLCLVPAGNVAELIERREWVESPAIANLPARWRPIRAWEVDPLVHVQLAGSEQPAGFSQGRTLRGGVDSLALRATGQHTVETADGVSELRTELVGRAGVKLTHTLAYRRGELALTVRTVVRNEGPAPLTLDLLTSFSLGGLTPFAADDAPGRLRVHRFRSVWSAEGRHQCETLEALHLERSWSGYGVVAERFGQLGSMPANGWFPFLAIEDRVAGVVWAAQLECPGTWQLEIFRRADQLAISGGLGDRDFGHWAKTLQPGEEFAAPSARLTCVAGSLDDACDRLLTLRGPSRPTLASERDLPVVFNEWCTSWGNPTHDNLIAAAQKLSGSGVRYLVIDDGWAERDPAALFQQNGDWLLNRVAFPQGLRATCDAIRECGLIPGLWFEPEVVNAGTRAFAETAHQLHRDGRPLQVGTRRFWDFRDPWVHDYLAEKVIGRLRDADFGYLKIDYNDSIGRGCDGAESTGEGLRAHLAGVQTFLARVRRELPELVVENCSSGGHRIEPSFLALTAMSSFSDAHETPDIPIIAANLHRLMPPAQSQIWAVLHAGDSASRLAYSLAAGFLGRLCLSGEIHGLSAAQWTQIRAAIDLYRRVSPLIALGRFRRHGERAESWQHPQGWQAVVADDGAHGMLVWHAFADAPATVTVPLPNGLPWRVCETFGEAEVLRVDHAEIALCLPGDWTGGVLRLTADRPL